MQRLLMGDVSDHDAATNSVSMVALATSVPVSKRCGTHGRGGQRDSMKSLPKAAVYRSGAARFSRRFLKSQNIVILRYHSVSSRDENNHLYVLPRVAVEPVIFNQQRQYLVAFDTSLAVKPRMVVGVVINIVNDDQMRIQ